ncbi:MAG: hypothetical protein JRC55_08005 [Deltaproteobacteria bacterium]|nr:hypothetical protein [Deltaproteobacteria bacterium]
MSENIVIVGAVAVGAKAACRFKRLRQDANVTIIDKDELICYRHGRHRSHENRPVK